MAEASNTTVTLQVHRFTPRPERAERARGGSPFAKKGSPFGGGSDSAARRRPRGKQWVQEYTIPARPSDTVLDCLLTIKRTVDPTLAFRYSCGHGMCGSDAVAINATFFVLVPAGILLAGAAGDFGAFLTNFLFYVIFSALTTMMMSKIMYSSQAVTEAQDAVSRIDGILSAPLMAEVDPARAEAPADDAIDFDHVTFSYPGADAPALEDVVLHVPSGATVALVGPSGGGKTTAASLVPRFWDASAGRVLVGGVEGSLSNYIH